MSSEPTLISSVRRALHLLEALSEYESGASAKGLARRTGLPPGTTYHLLRTLVHEGYAQKLEDGRFIIGDRLGAVADNGSAQAQIGRVRPVLTALRDQLGAAAYLTLFTDGEIRIVDIVDSTRAPRVDLWVGFTDAGHATALGKCVLHQLTEPTRQDYLGRHALADLTPHTVTRKNEVLRRLAMTAGDGLMLDREEYSLGTGCAAVPVTDGVQVGALGVSVPAHQLARIRGAADRLADVGGRVTRALSLQP